MKTINKEALLTANPRVISPDNDHDKPGAVRWMGHLETKQLQIKWLIWKGWAKDEEEAVRARK